MAVQQDIQRLFCSEELQRFFPPETHLKPLLEKYKDEIEVVTSWLNDLVLFEKRNTAEDRQLKHLLYKKIGIDEDTFKFLIKHGIDFYLKFHRSSSDEEFDSIAQERDIFFGDKKRIFMNAVRKGIHDKYRNSPLLLCSA